METIKKLIRRFGGKRLQNLIIWALRITGNKNKFILFSTQRAVRNRVNLNYWNGEKNLGDVISPVILANMLEMLKIDRNKQVKKTKHLYVVGSIITAGCQDCTVWGSGLLNTTILDRLKHRELDFRAVRGPISRTILMEYGFRVPEVYGDPAILMPMFFNPDVEKRYAVSVIPHMIEKARYRNCGQHLIDIMTDDYQFFIREIKASKLVISSSLHGLILAEAYGVPAILLKPQVSMLKYYDYYCSTGRATFPIAKTVEQALQMEPPCLPDFTQMAKKLIDAFPKDLWE